MTFKFSEDFCKNKAENKEKESLFELEFSVGDKFYAYGFSLILSQGKIIEEYLYELLEDGSSKNIFIRDFDSKVTLGDGIKLNQAELNRFKVYSEDFLDQKEELFLTYINNDKKFNEKSGFLVFKNVYDWLINNIIVIPNYEGFLNIDAYSDENSLEKIRSLIRSLDFGISEINLKQISINELHNEVSSEEFSRFFKTLNQRFKNLVSKCEQLIWKINNGLYLVKLFPHEEPNIITIVLKHDNSSFDFSFASESEGTKRFLLLVNLLLINNDDLIFAMDEIDRSWHPKLTQRFLELFMKANQDKRILILCSTYENFILSDDFFCKDEIIFTKKDSKNSTIIYPLDRFKEGVDNLLGEAYLDGRFGAIPKFSQFSFKETD